MTRLEITNICHKIDVLSADTDLLHQLLQCCRTAMSLLEAPSLIEAPGTSNTKFTEFINTCKVKHSTCGSKSQSWPPRPVSLLSVCLNRHISKHTISIPVMPKMARNRSALHDVLTQGASNRDIRVSHIIPLPPVLCYSQGEYSPFNNI